MGGPIGSRPSSHPRGNQGPDRGAPSCKTFCSFSIGRAVFPPCLFSPGAPPSLSWPDPTPDRNPPCEFNAATRTKRGARHHRRRLGRALDRPEVDASMRKAPRPSPPIHGTPNSADQRRYLPGETSVAGGRHRRRRSPRPRPTQTSRPAPACFGDDRRRECSGAVSTPRPGRSCRAAVLVASRARWRRAPCRWRSPRRVHLGRPAT